MLSHLVLQETRHFDSSDALKPAPRQPWDSGAPPTPHPPDSRGQVAPAQVGGPGRVQQHVLLGLGAGSGQVGAGELCAFIHS